MGTYEPINLVKKLAPLSRTLVHDDNQKALEIIKDELPELEIEAYKSGQSVWTWKIPNKWTLIGSKLEDAETGEMLWNGMSHPLATVNYSESFSGIVSKEEIEKHIYSSESQPDAIPFVYRFYNRDWGFCVPHKKRDSILSSENYKVTIQTEEQTGELLVGVLTLPGRSSSEFLILSNICHPSIANDSITGVAAAVYIAKYLASLKNRKYTYRFLFFPETIGSIAYLANNPDVVEKAKGGLFSEMLGNKNSHCFQYSRSSDTYWDIVMEGTMEDSTLEFRTAAFLESAANDEKVLDSPGVDIPCVSVTRYPYPEYHTSNDNADLINPELLTESCVLLCEFINRVENDYIPVYKNHGPVCLAEHGIYPDWYKDPSLKDKWDGFVKVMYALDGKRSCEELARDLGISVNIIKYWTEAFESKGFLERTEKIIT